jgi:hypothetical protein
MFRAILSGLENIRPLRVGSVVISSAGILVFSASPMAGQRDYLPTFRGAIDVTGFEIQIRATIPDRDSGDLAPRALPSPLLGPNMQALLSAPLSDQLTKAWNSAPNPGGVAPRTAACSQIEDALTKKVQIEGAVACGLATSGQLYYHRLDHSCSLDICSVTITWALRCAISLTHSVLCNHPEVLHPEFLRLIRVFPQLLTL